MLENGCFWIYMIKELFNGFLVRIKEGNEYEYILKKLMCCMVIFIERILISKSIKYLEMRFV